MPQNIIGNDFDVTGLIQVSDPGPVRAEIMRIIDETWPDAQVADPLNHAFHVFEKLYRGELPGYKACDTVYHDMQHSLDMTLAMARLLAGYESAVEADERLGAELAAIGLVCALFHDAGYIVEEHDEVGHGAEYTQTHVTRSAEFLERFVAEIGFPAQAEPAAKIVHFTGYEYTPSEIEVPSSKHRVVGQLLGTADLCAQMADRCYLEKCRDRLFPEFVIGGVAVQDQASGERQVNFESAEDLLRKTPAFFERTKCERLDKEFEQAYRYFENFFDGENPYMDAVQRNLTFLEFVLKEEQWTLLRRQPPAPGSEDRLADTHNLMVRRLRELFAEEPESD